ncbi:hypothetical protein TNCV_2869441 [Trichonephila clavipes]|nr:hypothetical protein TNCV_2869441 [Trichonephila clavipes]
MCPGSLSRLAVQGKGLIYPFSSEDLSWIDLALFTGTFMVWLCDQLFHTSVELHTPTAYKQRNVIRFLSSKDKHPMKYNLCIGKVSRFEKCEVVAGVVRKRS